MTGITLRAGGACKCKSYYDKILFEQLLPNSTNTVIKQREVNDKTIKDHIESVIETNRIILLYWTLHGCVTSLPSLDYSREASLLLLLSKP